MKLKLKLKLARLHPIKARASYRPVGLALWDSWGVPIPKNYIASNDDDDDDDYDEKWIGKDLEAGDLAWSKYCTAIYVTELRK
jgi:hypothetical protein